MPEFTSFQYFVLSDIETLKCHTEIEVNVVYFLWFCTKSLHYLKKKTVCELIVALSLTNSTINLNKRAFEDIV